MIGSIITTTVTSSATNKICTILFQEEIEGKNNANAAQNLLMLVIKRIVINFLDRSNKGCENQQTIGKTNDPPDHY
jgi:hypothetical protein